MAPARRSSQTLWVVSGLLMTLTLIGTASALHLLVGWPDRPAAVIALSFLALPTGLLLGRLPLTKSHAAQGLATVVVVGGLTVLVMTCYVVIVIGLGQSPKGTERQVLGLSMASALVAVVLVEPTRTRLLDLAERWSGGTSRPVTTALETFGARMTRAVPMEELLLQLAETLKATIAPLGAEIWTAAESGLDLTTSVPERPRPRLELGPEERDVVAHARVGGNAWLGVWLPALLSGREASQVRVAPMAHQGELLGLIVVTGTEPYGTEEDQVLTELARQVGLALHNVQLDSALQESLEELQRRNAELQASRARIVAASDASRRAIERNLHDGAQQHLVALAVKLSLVKYVLEEKPEDVPALLEELRADVQATTQELRELAHGIYPPLLRDRGLPEALRNAARRSTLPVEVCAELEDRYPAEAEAAVYFCCLEALQNAGKYAGADAEVTVTVSRTPGGIMFQVRDNGPGFEVSTTEHGHGFTNMADRLGAIGGHLSLSSTPGQGTVVQGELTCPPLAPAAAGAAGGVR